MKRRIDSPSDNTTSAKRSGRRESPEEIIRSSEEGIINHICTIIVDIISKIQGKKTFRDICNDIRNDICEDLDAISSQLSELSAEAITQIENRHPGTIGAIAVGAVWNHANALNTISRQLGELSKGAITQIESKHPGTIKAIAVGAANNHANALNAISRQLGKLSEGAITQIENRLPGTIGAIAAGAAKSNHAHALNAIRSQLDGLSVKTVVEMESKAAGTLKVIAWAAVEGHPHALNAISSQLGKLSAQIILGIEKRAAETIKDISDAAKEGHPHALNAISSKLGGLSAQIILGIENKAAGTIRSILEAAVAGHPHALNAISSKLARLTIQDIENIESVCSGTLKVIAWAAVEGHPHALNAISSQLGGLSAEAITQIENRIPGTIRAIAAVAAKSNHAHALNAISSQLARLTVQDIEKIEGACSETLTGIVWAAANSFGCALDALSSKWGQLSLPCIESVAAKAPQEGTVPLVEAARMGYETALIATIKKLIFANATTPNTHGRLSRLIEGLETPMIDHFNYEKREKKFGKKLWLLRVATEAGWDNLLDDYFITRAKKYSVALTWYKDIQVCAGSDKSPDKKIIEYVKDSLLIFCAEEEERKCRSHFLRELIDYYASLQKSYVTKQYQGILSDKNSRLQVWTNMLDKMGCSSIEDAKITEFLNDLDDCLVEYNAGINQGRPENSFDNIKKRFLQPRQESGQGFFSRITGERRQEMRWREQYAMLQEMLAVLGCYIQVTEGATLNSAQQEMKGLLAHWVCSCSDLADVNLDDISYQDLKTLLRNYDYGQAKDLLKAWVGSAEVPQEHANSVTS